MGKIVSLGKYTESVRFTPLMIKTLRAACKMQSNHVPFGQASLNGSFTALLKRGCIDAKTITFNGKKEVTWYVTRRGIKALDKLGFDEPCEPEIL
ncbi:MAG: hypothetical protein ABJA71_04040 [Ginsengibacter sp.]